MKKTLSWRDCLFWFVMFWIAAFLASVFVVNPLLMLSPEAIRTTVFGVSHSLADQLGRDSGMKVEVGNTCTEDRSACLRSFILRGPIAKHDGAKFERLLSELVKLHPDIDKICLDSGGGFNKAAAHIAGVVKSKGLTTCVGDIAIPDRLKGVDGLRYNSTCASACGPILMAGQKRIAVGTRFVIGLHGSNAAIDMRNDEAPATESAASGVTRYMSEATAKDVTELFKGKVSVSEEDFERFMDATQRTPFSRMYFATVAEQDELKLFTSRVLGKEGN